MTNRNILKILVGLLLLFSATIGLISINHPILLKLLAGSARIIGKPTNAVVYTNGKLNHEIKVFHVKKYWGSSRAANTYLLSLREFDSLRMLKFFSVNLDEQWIGRPVGTGKSDYDFIMGVLIQSETGGHFTPFQHPEKGFNFDPNLSFSAKEIKFNMPPNMLKFDSVRIELE